MRLHENIATRFEPYIFHKYTRLSSELYEGIKLVTDRNKKNDSNFDIYLGNGALYAQDSLMQRVLDKLFADEVPRYLMLCLRLDAFTNEFTKTLKLTLKMLGMYLDYCAQEVATHKFTSNHPVFDNLLKYYLKPELEKRIDELKKNNKLKEIKGTLERIAAKMAHLRTCLSNT